MREPCHHHHSSHTRHAASCACPRPAELPDAVRRPYRSTSHVLPAPAALFVIPARSSRSPMPPEYGVQPGCSNLDSFVGGASRNNPYSDIPPGPSAWNRHHRALSNHISPSHVVSRFHELSADRTRPALQLCNSARFGTLYIECYVGVQRELFDRVPCPRLSQIAPD
ncbi:hypothetical protein BU16DRAFT_16286 [Lophium mytilinum]|uniref:Uncharacterized protein n=1 Tax=Lophium mytilinum TaxID=390894 RepID=A0A6A6RFZ4_9PEZI|nr:hypothetical protein BU16DRAFT_16286 [Lophium mytilinum]